MFIRPIVHSGALAFVRTLPWVILAAACENGTASYPDVWKVDAGDDTTADAGSAVPMKYLPWLHVEGNQIKNESGDAVVLRGISTIDLGATNAYPGKALGMIDRLTDKNDAQSNSPGWYTSVIRLAIYPADSAHTDSPFTYDPSSQYFYDQLLRPVVDRCRQRGAYAIIDWHEIDDTTAHREDTAQFWRDMAPRFASDKDSHVIFELFNEPINYAGRWSDANSGVRADMQAWYDIVRSAAPKNLVLVGTPSWCQQLGDTATSPIVGENVAYVAHVYPYHFGRPEILAGIRKAQAVHPVFMSEWGFQQDASNSTVRGTITDYAAPFRQFVEELGLSWTMWCASDTWYPAMFNSDFTLRIGEQYEGGFVKDWLFESRDVNPPVPWE